MAGIGKISISWVFCMVTGLFCIHGSRASISFPTDRRRMSGMSASPSKFSGNMIPVYDSLINDHAISTAPLHSALVLHKNRRRHHALPLYIHRSSVSPVNAPYPSAISGASPTPSPTPIFSYTKAPIYPPVLSPSEPFSKNPTIPSPQPVKRLPPPPPNPDCSNTYCQDPSTNTPPGSPCLCVLPMKIGLRVNVALYAFFPLVAELAQEIASGVSMEQSQVRVMGANAATEEPEKTIVLIHLVPRGEKFDNNTAFLTFEKFWQKKISIKASYFGSYDVLSVIYPGLPPSPATAPTRVFGYSKDPMITHPFAVDVKKPKEKHSSTLIALIVLSSILTLVLCAGIALALFLIHRYCTRLTVPVSQMSLPPFAKSSVTGLSRFGSKISSGSVSMHSSIATHIGSVKTFSLSEIENATNKFNDSRIIGEGGFGLVYEGVLEDGTPVAVKVLKREDQQGVREFLAEVEMLSRLHHRNLVKLVGICTEEYIRCLVYELIPNGSVESHLYGVDKETTPLDWNSRMKIALGAARCLAYLHEDSNPHVIHRDFKSSNILLEHDFTPKLCDFGLARTASLQENEHISTRVMGTFGYVAPEYAMTGHLLVKSDVYSYGVVLLELLTGRKPVDMLRPLGQENLVAWARPLLTSKEGLVAIVDPSLATSSFPFDSLAKVAAIASMCIQPEVSHRPFMSEVVQALKLVYSENNENEGSVSYTRQELPLLDMEISINKELGIEEGTVLSPSDMLSISMSFTRDEYGSLRRYASAGPWGTGRKRQLWEWVRGISGGSKSEHGIGRHWRVVKNDFNEWSS